MMVKIVMSLMQVVWDNVDGIVWVFDLIEETTYSISSNKGVVFTMHKDNYHVDALNLFDKFNYIKTFCTPASELAC